MTEHTPGATTMAQATTTFTIADLPRSAFKDESEAGDWLVNNASAIRDALIAAGNDAIETYLEIDGRTIDYDEGHFEALPMTDRSHWGEHPDCPLADWQYEVANGDTRLGYWEWVALFTDRLGGGAAIAKSAKDADDADTRAMIRADGCEYPGDV